PSASRFITCSTTPKPNLMALVILACQAEAQETKLGERRLNEIKKRIVKGLIARGIIDTGRIARFIRFLNNPIYLTDKELNPKFRLPAHFNGRRGLTKKAC